MALSEFSLIDRFFRQSSLCPPDPDCVLGIGDDGAIVSVPADQHLVVAADTLVEAVHFPRGTPPEAIGYRALAVNLSDIAAMGAEPRWYSLCLTLPAAEESWLADFADGLAAAAGASGTRLVLLGGDTTSGGLSISIQLLGLVAPGAALTRSGACSGDAVFVTGTLGDAAAGLQTLLEPARHGACRQELVARFYRPSARLAESRCLVGLASSCIDVSDGLLADLGHICSASGVGARLRADWLPLSAALQQLGREQALACALSGGDDYELCFTVPEAQAGSLQQRFRQAGLVCTRVGEVTAASGVHCVDEKGDTLSLKKVGYEHFR